jgi:aryl-alcohol dehydrogenase-like predicted oxidoreductase
MSITRVGFGAWAIGGPGWETAWGPQDDADSIATIHRAVESGINWIDTAPIYGHGHSEEVVAAALAGIPAADRPYVFTKCALIWDERDRMAPPRRTLDRLRWQVEWSLRRLRVEVIDLLQVHWPPLRAHRWTRAGRPCMTWWPMAWSERSGCRTTGRAAGRGREDRARRHPAATLR